MDQKRSNIYTKIESLGEEPWVNLEAGKDLNDWGKSNEIEYNQSYRVTEKAHFYRKIFDYLNSSQINGNYYEFGCHRARTFRMALTESRKHNNISMRYLAFNSFEGLPEDWNGVCKKEHFKVKGLPKVDKNTTLIKGWFNETLDVFLNENPDIIIDMIHIDCDLYSSTKNVFNILINSSRIRSADTISILDEVFFIELIKG